MQYKPPTDVYWVPAPERNFTGEVWFGEMSTADGEEDVNVLGVQFAPGSRTDWHSHPAGQVLYVISGRGVVANEGGERLDLTPGTTVTAPANELHWHGAAHDSPMLHLSITHGGPTVWSDRKVTDSEYE